MQTLNLVDFFVQNKEWMFSGVGVFVLAFFVKRKTSENKRNSVNVKNTNINGDFTGRDRK